MPQNKVLLFAGSILIILYTLSLWWWKPAFVWGESRGIYWLLMALEQIALLLAGLGLIFFIVTILLFISQLVRRKSDIKQVAKRSGLLLLVSFLFIALESEALV